MMVSARRGRGPEVCALGEGQRQELSLHLAERAKGEHAGRSATRAVADPRRQAGERESGSRRERDEVEPHGAHACDARLERAPHAIGEGRNLASARRIGRLPLVAQAQDAELQRYREVTLASVGENELGRSTADVEERPGGRPDRSALRAPEVDEVRFLLAADDAHVDAELVANACANCRCFALAPALVATATSASGWQDGDGDAFERA